MALSYTKTMVELKEILLRNRPQELYDISPKGTVPVLYFHNGSVIDESLDIIFWALKNSDPDGWLLDSKDSQLDLVVQNDNDFKTWLDKYKYFDRYPEFDQEFYKEKCFKFLDILEQRLNKSYYLYRDTISMSDVAIFPFVRQFAHVENNLKSSHSSLFAWLEKIKLSDLFLSVMEKYDEYSYDQNPIVTNFSR